MTFAPGCLTLESNSGRRAGPTRAIAYPLRFEDRQSGPSCAIALSLTGVTNINKPLDGHVGVGPPSSSGHSPRK